MKIIGHDSCITHLSWTNGDVIWMNKNNKADAKLR